jgi:hypothetical protein
MRKNPDDWGYHHVSFGIISSGDFVFFGAGGLSTGRLK